jgi:hypothetical protein
MGNTMAPGDAIIDMTLQMGVLFDGLANQGQTGLAGNFHIRLFNLETLHLFTWRVTFWKR